MSYAEFSGETSSHPVDSAPLQPDLVPCEFCFFPKTKSPLKGKTFQTISEIQKNMTGQLMAIGRTVWGPKLPTLKGTEVSLSYIQCFLYLVFPSINVSIFHITWLDTFWTDYIYVFPTWYYKTYSSVSFYLSKIKLISFSQVEKNVVKMPWLV